MSSNNTTKINKTKKIVILFLIIFLFLSILVISIFKTLSDYRRLPTLQSTKKELSVRGDVVSADNFKIAS